MILCEFVTPLSFVWFRKVLHFYVYSVTSLIFGDLALVQFLIYGYYLDCLINSCVDASINRCLVYCVIWMFGWLRGYGVAVVW